MPFVCKLCKGRYCAAHRLPENHGCQGLDQYRQRAREEGRLYRGTPDVVSPSMSAGARASMSMDALWSKVDGKMTFVFLGIIGAMWVLQWLVLFTAPQMLRTLFVIQPDFYLRPWTLVTNIFSHDMTGFTHILFNGLFLFFFGTSVERLIGTRRFTWLFLGTGIVAGVAQVMLANAIAPPDTVVGAWGASGALQGIVGTLVILAPRLTVYVFGIVPAPLWAFAGLFVLLDVMGMLNPGSGVGHAAHLSGFAIGAAYGWHLKQKGLRVHTPRPQIRRYQ